MIAKTDSSREDEPVEATNSVDSQVIALSILKDCARRRMSQDLLR